MTTDSTNRFNVLHFAFSAVIFAAILAPRVAWANWEQLPDPPARFEDNTVEFEDADGLGGWMLNPMGGVEFAEPFMAADPAGKVYFAFSDDGSQFYNRWISFDPESEIYESMTPMYPTLDFSVHLWYDQKGSAAYVDDKIYFVGDGQARVAVYDVVGDSWSWNSFDLDSTSTLQSIVADEDHEILYWFNGRRTVGRVDPEVGLSSVETGQAWIRWYDPVSFTGLGVRDNEIYMAGGFYIYMAKGYPVEIGASLSDVKVYNFITNSQINVPDLPFPQKMTSGVWGSDSLHFLGSSYFMMSMMFNRIYGYFSGWSHHYSYNPSTNSWLDHDDMPLDCLPFAACGQGGWLYGLFVCPGTDEQQLHLYRTYIGNWGTSTSTTTTTTTTTIPPADDDTDDDTGDDDAGNDDLADDDLQASDDDSDASADDDDDAGGCGG